MKKLHSLAFYALVAPVITLTGGSVLAEQSTGLDIEGKANTSHQSEQGYLKSAPANGMRASHLIGTDVKASGAENIGAVSDLIMDENGQVVAIIIAVGGFLSIGEKDVAIGWDHVKRSGADGDEAFRLDVSRKDLQSAPKFEAKK